MARSGPVIVPAVLAEEPAGYERDLQVAVSLSPRIQVDLADGSFADNRTVSLVQAYWPETTQADLHLMYDDPFVHQETIIAQRPHLAIVHAEAAALTDDKLQEMCRELQACGIGFGLALLPDTPVAQVQYMLKTIDHLLIFTGELGHYGGKMRFDCLDKIAEAKQHNQNLEVGVDGGITDETAARVAAAGADVLNVGGFLQGASHPQAAYAKLESVIDTLT